MNEANPLNLGSEAYYGQAVVKWDLRNSQLYICPDSSVGRARIIVSCLKETNSNVLIALIKPRSQVRVLLRAPNAAVIQLVE